MQIFVGKHKWMNVSNNTSQCVPGGWRWSAAPPAPPAAPCWAPGRITDEKTLIINTESLLNSWFSHTSQPRITSVYVEIHDVINHVLFFTCSKLATPIWQHFPFCAVEWCSHAHTHLIFMSYLQQSGFYVWEEIRGVSSKYLGAWLGMKTCI